MFLASLPICTVLAYCSCYNVFKTKKPDKKKELTNTYYPTLLANHALNEIFALVYKGTCVMEDCAVKGSTAQIRGAVLKGSFFLSSANCSWTQNTCETPVLNALGQACKETEKLDH